MIYPQPEIKNKILEALPKDADNDIVRSALIDIMQSKANMTPRYLIEIIVKLANSSFSTEELIKAIADATTCLALARVKAGSLVAGVDMIQQEIYISWFTLLAKCALSSPEFKVEHQAQLNSLAYSDEGGEYVKEPIRHVLRMIFEDKLPDNIKSSKPA